MSRHLEDREETAEMSSHSRNLAQGVLFRREQGAYATWVWGECVGQGSFLSSGK